MIFLKFQIHIYKKFFLTIKIKDLESLRRDHQGNELPNPRIISRQISKAHKKLSTKFTNLLYGFGQFIDHDMTLSPIAKTKSGTFINCCEKFPLNKVWYDAISALLP